MPRRRKKGKSVKRNAAQSAVSREEDFSKAPHSFVVHKGNSVGKSVQELVRDFRRVMEPNTASNIKVRPKQAVKDFVHVAGVLGVSHLCMFTKTELGPYLKLARFPRGPTLTFKIREYVLARDVRSSLKRQVTYEKQYLTAPLLILNSFSGSLPPPAGDEKEEEDNEEEEEGGVSAGARSMELMSSMLQNMFPSINVNSVRVNSIRRCVLMDYQKETGMVEFRHYTIKAVPVGVSRAVKKIVQGKVPNLSRFDDMSEFLGAGNASESEAEDDEASKVTLPQVVSSRGNVPQQRSSIRLVELGPRMTLELIKVEEGLLEGEVLYHRFVSKTEEEKKAIRAAREKRKKEKERRRKEQDDNVKRKEREKEAHKEKSLKGMKRLATLPEGFHDGREEEEDEVEDAGGDGNESPSDDDDAKWYEEEVGRKPEKDMFDGKPRFSRKRKGDGGGGGGKPGFLPKRFKRDGKSGDRGGGRGGRGVGGRSERGGGFRGGRGGGEGGRGGRGGGRGRGAERGSRGGGGRGGFKTRAGGTLGRRGGGGRNNKRTLKGEFSRQGVGPNFKRNAGGASAGRGGSSSRGGKARQRR